MDRAKPRRDATVLNTDTGWSPETSHSRAEFDLYVSAAGMIITHRPKPEALRSIKLISNNTSRVVSRKNIITLLSEK